LVGLVRLLLLVVLKRVGLVWELVVQGLLLLRRGIGVHVAAVVWGCRNDTCD